MRCSCGLLCGGRTRFRFGGGWIGYPAPRSRGRTGPRSPPRPADPALRRPALSGQLPLSKTLRRRRLDFSTQALDPAKICPL
ncbi:hypothetical protein [Lysobacter gummosus]|uniref:hypothetical protein n=1 Tax=Lysobacter gummosus TaxID=262324 RepID=UPI00363A12E9